MSDDCLTRTVFGSKETAVCYVCREVPVVKLQGATYCGNCQAFVGYVWYTTSNPYTQLSLFSGPV